MDKALKETARKGMRNINEARWKLKTDEDSRDVPVQSNATQEPSKRRLHASGDAMQNHYMKRAIELAIANVQQGQGGPFAALIVKGKKILAEGTNQVTSTNDPTAHAEVVAIRAACRVLSHFQLTGCDIYTSCEPCPMCLGAIYWARPERIYFASTRSDAAEAGFDDSMIYEQIALRPEQRQVPMTQLMREEALEAFRVWEKKTDRVRY